MSIGGLGGARRRSRPRPHSSNRGIRAQFRGGCWRSASFCASRGRSRAFLPRSVHDTSPTGMRSTTFAVATRPVVQPPHCRRHSSTIGLRGCRTRPLVEHKSEQSSRKLLLVRVLPNESVLQALS
jgi:hypothetical protein